MVIKWDGQFQKFQFCVFFHIHSSKIFPSLFLAIFFFSSFSPMLLSALGKNLYVASKIILIYIRSKTYILVSLKLGCLKIGKAYHIYLIKYLYTLWREAALDLRRKLKFQYYTAWNVTLGQHFIWTSGFLFVCFLFINWWWYFLLFPHRVVVRMKWENVDKCFGCTTGKK